VNLEEENKENTEEKQEGEKEEKSGKKQNKLAIVLVVAVVVLAGLYFVGRQLSGILGQNIKVDSQGEKMTFTNEDGEVSFEAGGDLPESFPKDFPVYAGAKLVNSFSSSGEEGDGVSVVWEVSDSFDKVSDFYKKNLPEGGWKVESTFEQKDSLTSSFSKEEVGGFIGVTIGEGGKVTISVTIGVK